MQLSDEYQVTEHIFQPCVEFLEDEPKTKENVMKIRALAEFYDLEEVRQDCDELLRGMTLGTLSETVQFENVEKDKLQHFLKCWKIIWRNCIHNSWASLNVVCGCGIRITGP